MHRLSLNYPNAIQGSWTMVGLGMLYIFSGYETVKLFQLFFFFSPFKQTNDFQHLDTENGVFMFQEHSCAKVYISSRWVIAGRWWRPGETEDIDSLDITATVGQSCFLSRHMGQSGWAGQRGRGGVPGGDGAYCLHIPEGELSSEQQIWQWACNTWDWGGRGNIIINVKCSEDCLAQAKQSGTQAYWMVGWFWSREINAMAGVRGIQRLLEWLGNTLMLLKQCWDFPVVLWIRIVWPMALTDWPRMIPLLLRAQSPCATATEQVSSQLAGNDRAHAS